MAVWALTDEQAWAYDWRDAWKGIGESYAIKTMTGEDLDRFLQRKYAISDSIYVRTPEGRTCYMHRERYEHCMANGGMAGIEANLRKVEDDYRAREEARQKLYHDYEQERLNKRKEKAARKEAGRIRKEQKRAEMQLKCPRSSS